MASLWQRFSDRVKSAFSSKEDKQEDIEISAPISSKTNGVGGDLKEVRDFSSPLPQTPEAKQDIDPKSLGPLPKTPDLRERINDFTKNLVPMNPEILAGLEKERESRFSVRENPAIPKELAETSRSSEPTQYGSMPQQYGSIPNGIDVNELDAERMSSDYAKPPQDVIDRSSRLSQMPAKPQQYGNIPESLKDSDYGPMPKGVKDQQYGALPGSPKHQDFGALPDQPETFNDRNSVKVDVKESLKSSLAQIEAIKAAKGIASKSTDGNPMQDTKDGSQSQPVPAKAASTGISHS